MSASLATVTAIGVERSRRLHPSSQSAPSPSLERQLAASIVTRWAAGAPMAAADVDDVVRLLLVEGS